MPSEVRHLLFRPTEVVQAVKEYHRRLGAPLPSGSVARCGPEDEGGGVRFRITLVPDRAKGWASSSTEASRYEVVVEGPVLAAALILHCRDRGIPLAARAEKSLQCFGEQVCLISTLNAKRGEQPHPGQLRS